jgi:tetratricopeptide (TPR) repeat protein
MVLVYRCHIENLRFDEIENYGSTLRDCSMALTSNPSCSKAYYRSALALLALERVDEALDCCNRCLACDGQNKGVQDVKVRVEKAKAEKEEKERKRLERIQKEIESERRLKLAFRVSYTLRSYTLSPNHLSKERHLIVMLNPCGSTNPTRPTFDPEDASGKALIFPVFFLYPQYATSDIISQFTEDTPFAAHISTMFPPQVPSPEWDVKREYISGELVVYAITYRKRLLKVGKKMTLRDVFIASKAKEGDPPDGLELKDGCLTFVLLPKGDVEKKWVEECKRQRDNQ